MTNTPSTIQHCPVCDQSTLSFLMQTDHFPIFSNVLWSTREAALNAPMGSIHLVYCSSCGHVFNTAFEPEKMQYAPGYENSLHYSMHFQTYANSLAADLVERYQLYGKDIIEVGSGQGDFLVSLCQIGDSRGVGFDPSYQKPENTTPDGKVSFVRDYYRESYSHYPLDFLVCRHVLEHIASPSDFMAMLRRVIGNDRQVGVFFEVPNVGYTLHQEGIWDILYEHFSYFSASSLAFCFRKNGFHVLRTAETFGGQFLTIEAVSESVPSEMTPSSLTPDPDSLIALESAANRFSTVYQQKISLWEEILDRFGVEKRRVIIWGAGTKGVSFLNAIPTSKYIEYIVDINPRKQGMFVTGTGQQIVSPAFLKEYLPDTVIVMNPNYQDEIRKQLADLNVEASVLVA